MHVPDGFMDSPTCVAAGAVALLGVAQSMRLLQAERPDDDRAPMAALVATFVFAVQMVNVPIADGTSGHLIGAALAAVLVGPAAAIVCLSGVLLVQAVFFADGGVAALGVNVTLMALTAVMVGWAVFRGLATILPPSRAMLVLAAGAGGLVSVPVSAALFALMFALGGEVDVDTVDLLTSMVGWHSLIGVGEALVTSCVVAAVLAVRPDLVRGARQDLGAKA